MKTPTTDDKGMRLNRYVAHAGICSRRKADEHIAAGEVQVNGEVVLQPGHRVQPDDEVRYRGEVISPQEDKVYLLMNKPKNTITTVKDERGRFTVIDLLKGEIPQRVYPVGRLDRMTTGLLLLTNDGELAQKLSHPSYEVQKVYYVHVDQPLTPEQLAEMRVGVELEDGFIKPDSVHFIKEKDGRDISVEIHSGRNRIVRRLFKHFGCHVRALDRVWYAGLTKKALSRGRYRHLTGEEVRMLKHFV